MAGSPFRDYYADLGIPPGSNLETIKAAFRNLAKQSHPDKTGATDSTVFRRAREAFEKLINADFRVSYAKLYAQNIAAAAAAAGKEQYQCQQSEKRGEYVGMTRTEQYEAELREARRRRSPPPKKPAKKMNETNTKYFTSRAYTAWQKRDAQWRARHEDENTAASEKDDPPPDSTTPSISYAHGLQVQMHDHPCGLQRCTHRTQHWRLQTSGTDFCVFCIESVTRGSKCSACEALACQKCLGEIERLEREVFGGWGAQYRASGG
ncbi:hypothetical protein BDW02DRAFT_562596 [Decorospora gaudefroyi]|uniref:J domain-containing protein n=1 Tax=Decorospora gaudefroyi TaxID=184978 RepID=A0A6A5K377_9PLEO|nr:hypothetical protein BDW02DRAFT_562596 [Decorospora gaudefroyi]